VGQVIDLDAIRFWDSKNLAINEPDRGQQYRVTLNRKTRTFVTPVSPPIDMGVSSDRIYVAQGQIVDQYESWTNTTPTSSFDFGIDVEVIDVSPSGQVYVLTTDGHLWYKAWDETTYTEVYDLTGSGLNDRPLTNIWFTKDRLLAERINPATLAGAVELVSGSPIGTGDPEAPTWTIEFITVDTARGRFRSIIDAGSAIVAGLSDGSIRSYVPERETSGSPTLVSIRGRTQVATSEEILSLGWSNGTLIILTTANEEGVTTQTTRAYSGEVLSEQFDYVVGNLQLLRTWAGTLEAPSKTKNIVSNRDLMFWTIEESATEEFVWTYNTITTGIYRQNELADDVTAIVLFDSVAGAIDVGNDTVITTDLTQFVETGYIISPNINFGLNTPINWIAVVLEGQDLEEAGDQIEMWLSTDPEAINDPDDPSWVLAVRLNHPSQSGVEVTGKNIQATQIAIQIKMYSTVGNTVTPSLTRFAIRGFPAHRDFVTIVPVNVSDIVSAPGRMPYRIPGLGNVIHRRLLARSGDNVELEVLDPPIRMFGVVDQVDEPTTLVSDRGSTMRVCEVLVRGTLQVSSITGGFVEGLGIPALGVGELGIDKTLSEIP
jgi:hypothetical protein